MHRVTALLALATVMGAAGCGEMRRTRAYERGRWAITRYLVRTYKIDQKSAYTHAKEFLAQKEYEITEDAMPRLLKGVGNGRSLIIRTREVGVSLTQIEFKAGPAYDPDITADLMDEYQKLLPAESQPE